MSKEKFNEINYIIGDYYVQTMNNICAENFDEEIKIAK